MFLTSERQRLIQERINLEDQINVEKGTLNKIRNDMRRTFPLFFFVTLASFRITVFFQQSKSF